MARKPRPWFRFYVESFGDRKIRRLPPAQRWLWVAILGAARESPKPGHLYIADGVPMTRRELADYADVPMRDVTAALPLMVNLGMLTIDDDLVTVLNWDSRQYESDNVTARTRTHRERSKERSGNGHGNAPETETEAETETEINQQGGQRPETLPPASATKPPQDPTRCKDHQTTDSPPPCRGCKTAREAHERDGKRHLAVVADCAICGGSGWIEDTEGNPVKRCKHQAAR